MSLKKLLLPVSIVVAFAFLGGQVSGAGAAEPERLADGGTSAKDVRTMVLLASGATQGRAVNPKIASIQGTSFKIRSKPCSKGYAWKTYTATPTFNRGTLCNGQVRFERTERRSRHYFQSRMWAILSHILTAAKMERWGPGQVMSINSDGKVATVYFWNYVDGKPSTGRMLRIVGSELTVKDLEPGT